MIPMNNITLILGAGYSNPHPTFHTCAFTKPIATSTTASRLAEAMGIFLMR
jgi:hypothetical protein